VWCGGSRRPADAGALRERLTLFGYFLAFWLVFLFFYAGSYNYGADVRYSLMTFVPIAILAQPVCGVWRTMLGG
jgi:hypothetical protein